MRGPGRVGQVIPVMQVDALRAAANAEPSSESAGAQLAAVTQLLSEVLPRLEVLIREATDGPQPLDAAAHHLVAAGGKRVRPLAALLMTRASGGDPAGALHVAAAAELIHSATLLHDDVIDEGEERRGRPASRVLWGNLVSVLGGDLLLTRALQLVDGAGVPGVMGDLLSTLERLVGGEVEQLKARGREDLGLRGYLDVVEGKTASLFGFACRGGARVAGREDLVEPAGEFGEKVGVAFQVIDDVLDLAGDPERVGKRLGADLAEGKTTLPLVFALETDRAAIAALLPAARAGDLEASHAVSRHPAVREGCARAHAFARDRSDEALALLDQFPDARARDLLRKLAAALTHREQ
mgnify:CR=1 FL=1